MTFFVTSRNACAQAQAQGNPDGGVPQSLQQKMHQLQALVEKLQQQGADLQPLGDLMQGLQPLMQAQRFAEAEALVDRAINLAAGLKPSLPAISTEQASQPLQPLRPRGLLLQNQLWGSLRATIVDHESRRAVVGVRARIGRSGAGRSVGRKRDDLR
ncbi:MAG: hypothetical protein ABR555_00825, partial [Pyrinomonadaceae bacterium]